MAKEHQILYPAYLLAEDKTLKIYVDEENELTFIPFPSHYIAHPGLYEHFTHVKSEPMLIREHKDYGRHDQPMDDADDDILAEIQEDD